LNLGLVTETADDPLARAEELAHTVAAKSPAAIRATKRLCDVAERSDRTETLMAESTEQAALMSGPEFMEQVAANLQKRAAVFK
jgi:enoyl-CoA hydratase/carnithine racemase